MIRSVWEREKFVLWFVFLNIWRIRWSEVDLIFIRLTLYYDLFEEQFFSVEMGDYFYEGFTASRKSCNKGSLSSFTICMSIDAIFYPWGLFCCLRLKGLALSDSSMGVMESFDLILEMLLWDLLRLSLLVLWVIDKKTEKRAGCCCWTLVSCWVGS